MEPVLEDVPTSSNEALIALPSPAHFFQNATGFGIEGSQFMNVSGNINIHPLVAPSAVREQSTGTGTANASVDSLGDAYTDSGSYCSQLLRRGRGFPLYVPGPQRNLPREYQRQGVAIGDVGRVTPEGIFDFFFNIYLDADDPINAENVPEGFHPLKRYVSRDIVHLDFESGSHVSTPSVQKQDLGSSSSEFPGLNFAFNCNAPQGAVLAIPHGSQLKKLENMEHMRRYAAKNAESWYKYVNGERGRGLANGALYLVTGFEKSRSWGMAAFQEVTTPTAFQLSLNPTLGDRYRWTASGPAITKASGSLPINDGPLNQTLFIHGLSISLGTGVWGRLFKGVEVCQIVDSQLGRANNEFVPYASQGFLFSWSLGFLGGNGAQGGKQLTGPGEDPNGVMVSEFPPTSHIFHPSQVINAYLLAQFPNATVVMSHDDHWRDILRCDDELAMGNPVILLQQICDQCVAIEDNGTIFLAKKDPEIRSTSNSTGQPVFPTGMEQALHSPPRSISPSPSPKINADNNMSRPSSPGSELDDYTSDHAGFHGKNTERLVKPKSVASPRQLHELEQENARLLEENGQLRSTLPVSIWSSRGNPTTSFSHSPPSVVGPSVLQTQYRSRGSPESLSPSSPFATTTFPESFPPTSTNYAPPSVVPTYPPVDPREAEILRLRKRVHELEQLTQRTEDKSLELGYTELIERFLFPTSTPAPATTGFQASWKARTDARIRQFCALNRAGNALCAWHDSRRERRVYPPRMAPDGYLNCGCTYEEALFEESLSRHGVGSYLPGDTVRMDPSLRNPLLKLLERRFGYKDGDFERDPHTGDWLPGEGPAVWEAQIQHDAGGPSRRARPAHRDWIPGASPTLWDAQIQAEALIKKEEANDSMEF